ncbi:hypothetical protein PF010_g4654 [Phytophthora fragariae]|uniref:RxLR effector protein n=1 Tax=Phytophthora fragariae TaxID=53985 RepID=A0A6A3FW80_9STRA|nr:hypothetical protein PF009_g1780 [Phytophthora fragariae]KAE9127682.1 hypothetical protein PF007_g5517 [Phytophthora fragariae]KAE9128025.1 hypothetical protein PF010_g4654 [Phytophthora fragariae]KAE9151111.1 hypothetical protein PF006_g4569 [Phytophthora fragariae]KAE9246943.1 hypothetical protein PF004_g4547 [Phytophthora fragariae]
MALLTVFKHLLPWWVVIVSAVGIRSARDATTLSYLLQKDCYNQIAPITTVWTCAKLMNCGKQMLTRALCTSAAW